MKAYVITIMDNPKSVAAANRCIASGAKYGIEIKQWEAFTPKHNPKKFAKEMGLPTARFEERWSRFDNALSAFLSHYCIWRRCQLDYEDMLIFEHDAVIKGPIPSVPFQGLLSYGAPSYGNWNTPQLMGVNPLTSKRYLPGAHAYKINTKGAEAIIGFAQQGAAPTDVYLCLDNFPWIEEYYPWPVVADDSFTTIQNEYGIQAKHSFKRAPDKFEII